MSSFPPSELILNADGSVYHLKLLPEDIPDTIITVGDPDRVEKVSRYFDSIEVKKSKREFTTHVGHLKGQRIMVISTGIGAGNIDILMNELDALINIDLKTRTVKPQKRSLNIIRLGTAGCLERSVPVGGLVASRYAVGLDGLLSFYPYENTPNESQIKKVFLETIFPNDQEKWGQTYLFESSSPALDPILELEGAYGGTTITLGGFYGPQGRRLRGGLSYPDMVEKLQSFEWKGNKVINLEMETAALYGLSSLLGHHCCSVSAIIAHRHFKEISVSPDVLIDEMIQKILGILVKEQSVAISSTQ